MARIDSGATLCTFQIKVVTQPGQNPSELYAEVGRAIEKVCGASSTLSRGATDPEAGLKMTRRELSYEGLPEEVAA